MNKYILAFDVGGLFIKSTILNQDGGIIPDTYAIFPSKSKEAKEKIIEHLFYIMKQQLNRILDKHIRVIGVGFAFPGPFDYDKGISFIKGVDKFDQLYGVNIRSELLKLIKQDRSFSAKIENNFIIQFDNDANLFALGEQKFGKGQKYKKSIYLTIGTGAGSAFMEQGHLIKKGYDIPINGWIYNEPFKGSIVDDYISKRGIMRIAKELGVIAKDGEVKTLSKMARQNNQKSQKVFHRFGKNIGFALNPYIKTFTPEAIVMGGQIAKSKDLFIEGVYETLENKTVAIELSEDSSLSTFKGVANLIHQSIPTMTVHDKD